MTKERVLNILTNNINGIKHFLEDNDLDKGKIIELVSRYKDFEYIIDFIENSIC